MTLTTDASGTRSASIACAGASSASAPRDAIRPRPSPGARVVDDYLTLRQNLARPIFLTPADGRAAFERGSVDAWVIWEPFLAAAQKQAGARILADGNGVVSTVFRSTNSSTIFAAFQNGWVDVEMLTSIPGAHPAVHTLPNDSTSISGRGQPTTTGNSITYIGLPVIGFAAISFTNGTLVFVSQNVLSNYGGSFVHKTNTLIQ